MKSTSRQRGFTLVELLVTMAILAIITAIAYPSYRSSVLKSHRADAKAALMQGAQALERCYTEYSDYTNANCPSYPTSGTSLTSQNGFYAITGTVTPTTYSLTATAIGDQVNDGDCQTFSINNLNQKTATGSNSSSCW